MIENREELHIYIKEDLGKYYSFWGYLLKSVTMFFRGTEALPMFKFRYTLRHYEYYFNQKSLGIIGKIKKQYWRYKYRHYELKYGMFIEINSVDMGLKLVHPGFRKVPSFAVIGRNCTILPMVLIGKKKPGLEGKAIIGDNCYISTGVTILAPVKIGNNVTIGAGAVVTKDVPSNAVVAGVPAKIIN